jgi:hypothetical protein
VRAWLAVAAAGLAACGTRGSGDQGSLGAATGAALLAAIEEAAATVAPWRCAALDGPTALTAPRQWALVGRRLERAVPGKPPAAARLAVVAGARGADDATATALAGLRAALDAAPVDVVITLGGMGATRQEIARALAPLAVGAPWLVVAVPGDRESIVEHRAAIAGLAATGAMIADGSEARAIELGVAVLGTLPGAPFAERLGAAAGGCVHDDADVAAILAELELLGDITRKGEPSRPLVLLGQRAPRGDTDLAPGGLPAGDPAYAAALAERPVDLVIHAAVDDVGGPAGRLVRERLGTGRRRPATGLPIGVIDGAVRYDPAGVRIAPSAMLVTVGRGELAWKPLAPTVVP